MNSPLQDVAHPIWGILRLIILMLALTAILYFMASRFDETEIKTLIYAFLSAAGLEVLPITAKKIFGMFHKEGQ